MNVFFISSPVYVGGLSCRCLKRTRPPRIFLSSNNRILKRAKLLCLMTYGRAYGRHFINKSTFEVFIPFGLFYLKSSHVLLLNVIFKFAYRHREIRYGTQMPLGTCALKHGRCSLHCNCKLLIIGLFVLVFIKN